MISKYLKLFFTLLLLIGFSSCSDNSFLEKHAQAISPSGYWPGGMRAKYVTQTTAVLHVYADGTSGSDSNNGLTALTPKKTIAAVVALLPFNIKNNTAIHLTGTFGAESIAYISRYVGDNIVLIIDGGTALTTVADNSGSPWTADIHSTSTLGLTTAGWTADAYTGYILELVSGYTAQTRLITQNTADTIYPSRNFSADPGLAQFRISKPSTILNTGNTIYLNNSGPGILVIQNLSISSGAIQTANSSGQTYYSHLISDSTAAHSIGMLRSMFNSISSARYNVTTFTKESGNTYSNVAVSVRNSSSDLYFINMQSCGASQSFANNLYAQGINNFAVSGGRYYQMKLDGIADCVNANNSGYHLLNATGYYNLKIGNASKANGILINSSTIRVKSTVDISNNTSHGIVLNKSFLHLDGGVTGTGNGGAGVYAHSGSVVHVKHGAVPTITGTVGNLSFDGTTEASTWAAIDGGTPATSTAEMSLAKEVP